MKTAIVMLSNRHVHLTREAADILFGEGYELTVKKLLGHPIFAANETVTLKGPGGAIEKVRILGPFRPYTQAEILRADNFVLGIDAPVKISGSPQLAPLQVIGPKGTLQLDSVALIAKRHIHLSESLAAEYGVKKGEIVSVRVGGERALVFNEVVISYTDIEEPTFHVDVEEGNAAGLTNLDVVEIITGGDK